jgi:hypothetical protein
MRRTAACLLLLALPLPLCGQAPPPNRGALARAIQLTEKPEAKGIQPSVLPFGTETQDVDINSTIQIRISKDDLLGAVPAALQTVPAQEADLLLRASRDLEQASAGLKDAVAAATRFVAGLKAGNLSDAELDQLARRDDTRLAQMVILERDYVSALAKSPNPEHQRHAQEADAKFEDVLLSGQRFTVAAFLVDELEWTLAQLAAADQRLAADPPPVALVLSATHIHEGKEVEVGLPHYNDLPIGAPQSIDKTSLVLTAEDQQRVQALQQQYAALAKLLNDAVDGSVELKVILQQLLQAQGIDLAALRTDLDSVKGDVDRLRTTDWETIAKQLEDQARAKAATATAADKKILEEKILPAIASLRNRATDLRTALEGLRARVEGLRAQVAEGAASTDPATALAQILSIADTLAGQGQMLQSLLSGLAGWQQSVKDLQAQVKTVTDSLGGLGQTLKSELQALLTQTAQAQVGDLATHLGKLRDDAQKTVQQAQALFARTKGATELASSLDRKPPEAAFHVAFGEIRDTWVDLRTLNPRADDDVVILRAWLYRIEKDPANPGKVIAKEELASDAQPLRMLRFGWYTNPFVGLVYSMARDKIGTQDKETRAFAPMVAWMWRHRTWDRDGGGLLPLRYRPDLRDSFALGLHTLSLDLDKDNQQEIGLGIGVSFFNGYLQIGGGVDLSLDKSPKYIFIGTKLFDLLRNSGVIAKPAATTP